MLLSVNFDSFTMLIFVLLPNIDNILVYRYILYSILSKFTIIVKMSNKHKIEYKNCLLI